MILASSVFADETGEDSGSIDSEEVHEFADREVDQYVFVNDAGKEIYQRHPKSLLRWSNATRFTTYGDTYVWTDRGCAKAIVSIFAVGEPRNSIAAECQSLSGEPFKMRRGETVVWAPKEKGVEFKKLNSHGTPGKTVAARGIQMSRIARDFRAEFAPHTAPDQFTQLRLLSRPLYRYQSSNPDIVDGAVYGFVNATDPELLLVLEARRDGDDLFWHYAPARSRHDQIRLYLDQKLVWDSPSLAPPWNQIRNPTGTYFNLRLERIADPAWLRASAGR